MYRFLWSPRWIGLGVLMTLAAVTMVSLGLWQLDRYHFRSEINARIDAASAHPPLALTDVLTPPSGAGPGAPPAAEMTWSLVEVAGTYDPAHEILARARTVRGSVGFEVVTPLVLADGSAILVDRGWIASAAGGAAVAPQVPPAPTGQVTVVGRVHAPESRSTPAEPFDGRVAVRRISPGPLAASMPYALYGGYLTLESQTPPADARFVAIPPDHENAAMNAGYVVQWWAFASLTLAGFGYLVIREARGSARGDFDPDLSPSTLTHTHPPKP